MAEESVSLAQRVEALEQISHARVVERIGQIEQRVSRIESAREAEEPHVATKADIARLETLVVEFRGESQAQIGDFRAELQAQIGDFRAESQAQVSGVKSDLEDRIGALEVANEKQYRQFLMWLIGTAITTTGVIIAAVAAIVGQLS